MTQANPSGQDARQLLFTEAVCARLCHDLSGPLGTVLGALEMVAEDPGSTAEAMPLANEAASVMGNRLRLLRAAWGGDCGPLGMQELGHLSAGLPSRVRVNFDALHPGPFSAACSRVMANLLLLGSEAMPRGGLLSLSGAPGQDVLLTIDGPGAAWPANLAAALRDPASVPLDNPRAVQSPITAMLARAGGMRLSIMLSPGPAATGVAPLLLTLA